MHTSNNPNKFNYYSNNKLTSYCPFLSRILYRFTGTNNANNKQSVLWVFVCTLRALRTSTAPRPFLLSGASSLRNTPRVTFAHCSLKGREIWHLTSYENRSGLFYEDLLTFEIIYSLVLGQILDDYFAWFVILLELWLARCSFFSYRVITSDERESSPYLSYTFWHFMLMLRCHELIMM